MKSRKVPVVFLDRDGVINAYPGHFKYVTRLKEFRMLRGAAEAVARLNRCGFKVFVISNQAGVSKGLYSRDTFDKMTCAMRRRLAGRGGRVDGVFYCTHRREERCGCRKPRLGLIRAALKQVRAEGSTPDLKASFFIGDSMIDIDTGKAAGVTTILVYSGREKPENRAQWESKPDYACRDLSRAVSIVCSKKPKERN